MATKICPKCKIENPIEASFCRHCGYTFTEESKNGTSLTPKIKEFLVVESFYTVGSVINLMWDVENYTSITLNGELVTNRDSSEILVEGDMTLDLIATNDYAQDLKRIRITPSLKPKIIRFDCDRHNIKEGDEIKITWDYRNTDIAIIKSNLSKEEIHLALKRTIKYKPKVGEVLTLVCYSKDPKVFEERELELTIIDNVVIDSFTTSSNNIIESTPVTLSWSVRNAHSLILYPEGINVLDRSSIVVYPKRSTQYRLEASNSLSTKTEIVAVGVKPLPKFEYSMPDCSSILKMPSINLDLSKLTSNIDEINIDKWMLSPSSAKKENKIITYIKRIFNQFFV